MTVRKAVSILLAAAVIAAAVPSPQDASARSRRGEEGYGDPHPGLPPLLAIVALKEQHVTIYDAQGRIMQAPVSTGQTGRETPAGIFSIVQKEVEHHSNLYDDASMPFMERITWTGIALHAGVLPGYPASHGCVRMPHDFAEKLYDLTKVGMRVLIVREDMAPVEIAQPAMFNARGDRDRLTPSASLMTPAAANPMSSVADYEILRNLRLKAAAKSADVQTAARREKEAKLSAQKANAEAAAAMKAKQAAEAAVTRAEAEVKALNELRPEGGAEASEAEKADAAQKREAAKAKAVAKLEASRSQLDATAAQASSKEVQAAQAQNAFKAAATSASIAADAAEHAMLDLSPVSVFISRKLHRLYVRRDYKPVYEGPVTIADADRPIGTFIFTALDYQGTGGALRWNVVSMYKNPTEIEPFTAAAKASRDKKDKASDPVPTNTAAAQAALDRLGLPEEALSVISRSVLPGSSLIISDEGLSIETGKDTDFVVAMSGEPQGGLTIRAAAPTQRPRRGRDGEFGFGGGFGSWFGGDEDDRRRPSYSRPRGGFGGGGGGFSWFN